MSLEQIVGVVSNHKPFSEVLEWAEEGERALQLEGLTPAAKPLLLAALFRRTRRTLFAVTYSQEQAERIAEDLSHYGIPKDKIAYLPPSDSLIYEEGPPDYSIIGERLSVLHALASGKRVIAVAPINAALRRTMPRESLLRSYASVKVGDQMDIDKFAELLSAMGYEHTDVVDRHGEFAKRGGLVDVYASNEEDPIRIELFGDEIESIRHFDSASQRSIDKIPQAEILPAREVLLDPDNCARAAERIKAELEAQVKSLEAQGDHDAARRLREKVEDDILRIESGAYFDEIEFYLPYLHPEECSAFDYLPSDSIVVLDEPMQLRSHWDQHEEHIVETLINRAGRGAILASQERQHVPFESTLKHTVASHQTLILTLLPRQISWARADRTLQVSSAPTDSFAGHVEAAVDQIQTWAQSGLNVVIATAQDARMVEILQEHGVAAVRLDEEADVFIPDSSRSEPKARIFVAHAPIRSGYRLDDVGIIVLTDSEVFGAPRLARVRKRSHEGIPISSVLDLKEGDYVVHVNHGIGYYRGIHKMKTQGVEREYLLLEYAHGDKLYVPTDQIDRVQKYIGGEGTPPVIHRLGGSEWARTTKRVSKAVEELAKELVELYAWRQALEGHAFSPDTPWQQELESSFPYEETPDQLQAIRDVKRDLESPRAMDRLICGDVGYGKTEVAIRAAFKVVCDGRQVAVLCPTTVLAQQHFNTFKERLAAFPITIEMLSRFRSRSEQKEVIEGLKYGTVDIVIGTHRLLSNDVQFKDLGLLVIDEEQRFGVRHKEKLRMLKKTVDTLTMTATPIPRTLHMSLSGIRDMSIINDPPEGRMPIKTFVKEADPETIRQAIVRELDRGGQVFFVHNRVENIGHIADQVQKLVPYARVDVAHGQMPEAELEKVMMDFYEHKFDVLVCTTIIESGLDIPNANTIIINEADKLGLAQLYQLRGRVGRSDRQAYAYLLYKPDKVISEVAEKRLDAIREFTELGSGFRIALRDLEIRGAGNLLGPEQSGQMAAVGFDLYCQLLAKAVAEVKGEEVEEIELPPVDLPIDAYIPQDYMPNEAHRILFYKKLAAVKTAEELQSVQDELEDRYGDPPRAVWNMLAIIRLRIRCRELGIESIAPFKNQIRVNFGPGVRLDLDIRKELSKQYPQHYWEAERLVINPSSPRILAEVEDMVEVLAHAFRRMKIKYAASS
ncbi:MAG: transcription-repair coupling factor [Armatimonadota bacterium]|nr:transcription-repair coupling factor [Armatimonadota bacterium]